MASFIHSNDRSIVVPLSVITIALALWLIVQLLYFYKEKKIGANFTYMYCIFPIFMVFFFVLQLNDCVYLRCTRAHSRGILNQVYMLLTIESIRLIRISLGFFLSNEE